MKLMQFGSPMGTDLSSEESICRPSERCSGFPHVLEHGGSCKTHTNLNPEPFFNGEVCRAGKHGGGRQGGRPAGAECAARGRQGRLRPPAHCQLPGAPCQRDLGFRTSGFSIKDLKHAVSLPHVNQGFQGVGILACNGLVYWNIEPWPQLHCYPYKVSAPNKPDVRVSVNLKANPPLNCGSRHRH